MDMKEKLVELLYEIHSKLTDECCLGGKDMSYAEQVGAEADHLIANGVTVQEGKPLEAFLHPVVAYEGLKAKYLVFGAASGKEIKNCFVLRPDKDPAAVEALRAYASATDNETLAEDIYNWVGKGEPVQEWISVKDERKPKAGEDVLVVVFDGYDTYTDTDCLMRDGKWCFETENHKVTHWQPMPQPPKGE